MADLVLDEDEKKRLTLWKADHYALCDVRPDSLGTGYHFEVVPSGIGYFVRVKCACGAVGVIQAGSHY